MKVLLLCLSCFPLLGATFLPALEDSTRSHSYVATNPIPCNPGPWGQLEYYSIYLEAPDHIADLISAPSDRTIWHFPGKTLDEIDAILTTALIDERQRKRIYNDSDVFILEPPYRLFPAIDIVESMNPLSRQTLYRHLSPWSENRFYRRPIIIESGDVRSWFANSNLTDETILHISKLTYRLGNSLAFSDIPAVLTRIDSDKEEREFLRAITRTRSLVLRMTISADSDFAALKDYWTLGKNGKDLMSFFDSVSQTPAVEKVDVIHLLPSTPRKYLNTFPSLSLGMDGQYPGHFWTSLNFGRYNPLSDFDEEKTAIPFIQKFYRPVAKPYRFGDLLLFFDVETSDVIHTCVYIADDIVYTRNDRSPLRPFMLMKIGDLLTRIRAANAELGIEALRRTG